MEEELINKYARALQIEQDEKLRTLAFERLYVHFTNHFERAFKASYERQMGNIYADDVVQDTLMQALIEHIDSYDPKYPFSAWINAIFHNCVSFYRNRDRRSYQDKQVPGERIETSLTSLDEHVSSSKFDDYDGDELQGENLPDELIEHNTPEHELHADEINELLAIKFESLPPKQRYCFEEFYGNGTPYHTIAKNLKTTEVNARKLAHKARQVLLEEAAKYGAI